MCFKIGFGSMESFFSQRHSPLLHDVEMPRDHTRRKRWPLLIALHGYEGNKDSMMRVAVQIADGAMVVISLQGPYQFLRRFGRNPKNYRVGFGWGTMYKMEDSIQLHHRDLDTVNFSAPCGPTAPTREGYLLTGVFAGLRAQLSLRIYPPAGDSRRHRRVRRRSRRLDGESALPVRSHPGVAHRRPAGSMVLAGKKPGVSPAVGAASRHPRFPLLQFSAQVSAHGHSPNPAMDIRVCVKEGVRYQVPGVVQIVRTTWRQIITTYPMLLLAVSCKPSPLGCSPDTWHLTPSFSKLC